MDVNEEFQGLWIGHFAPSDGTATIRAYANAHEEAMIWAIRKSGEVMLRGRFDVGRFVLEDVLRLAFAGMVVDEYADSLTAIKNPFGQITIVGPLPEDVTGSGLIIEQSTGGGRVSNLKLQVHYRQLTLDAINRTDFREKDIESVIPPTVRMTGTLTWRQVTSSAEDSVWLTLNLELTDDPEYNAERGMNNLAYQIKLDKEVEIEFVSAATALSDDSADFIVEDSNTFMLCQRPSSQCDPAPTEMLVRRIPIRFVCLFNPSSGEIDKIRELCAQQVNGVCKVWRSQAILSVKVLHDGLPVVEFLGAILSSDSFTDDQSNWNDLISIPAVDDPERLDVFIVREVDRNGTAISGVSYNWTVVSAGVVLSYEKLVHDQAYEFTLAHELGHCLGLEHPTRTTTVGGIPLRQGSKKSVMHIDINDHAPEKNSIDNCIIFGDGYKGLLNPLAKVIRPLRKDCLRPAP